MIFVYIVALLISTASIAVAQPATPQHSPKTYSLNDCIKTALELNYSVKIADNQRKVTANNLTPAPFLPTLSANARQTQEVQKDYTTNQYSADLSLNWRLFDGMSMFADYKVSQQLLAQGELSLRNNIENLVADISQQYYNIVTQQNRLEAVKTYLEISTMRYNQAREKYMLGTISGLEMKQAKIDLNADSSRLVLQQETIDNAYISLCQIMNIDLATDLMLGDTITPNGSLLLETLQSQALTDNTSVLSARYGETISNLDLKIARSAQYPTLDFNSAYRFNRTDTGVSPTRLSQTNGPTWGFTLSAKLFDGTNTRRKIKNAEIISENSSLTLRSTELNIASDITRQYNTYRKNFMMISFEQESSESARLNMDAAMEMYRIGTMSGIEFREIQRSYIEAVDRKLSAIFQAKISEIELSYLSGQLLK